jgi:hypothetical protein
MDLKHYTIYKQTSIKNDRKIITPLISPFVYVWAEFMLWLVTQVIFVFLRSHLGIKHWWKIDGEIILKWIFRNLTVRMGRRQNSNMIVSICRKLRGKLDRVDRSQDLPGAYRLLASCPVSNTRALTVVPICCCCFVCYKFVQILWDLRLSRRRVWRWEYPGIQRLVVPMEYTDVSDVLLQRARSYIPEYSHLLQSFITYIGLRLGWETNILYRWSSSYKI